ncbi:hypothetical protein LTR60_004673, partial [Cryomyces antarcticus]
MADATPKWTDSGKVGSYSAGVGKFVLANGEVKAYEPAYTGSTADVKAITGVVGSWAWEKWMLKLQMEMGKDGERLLKGVATALEEGGKCGAGWRVLTGFAHAVFRLEMLFFSFFKTLVDHEVTVELKNDISIRGTLKSVDQFLNIKLDDISVVEEIRWPHL